MSRPSRPKGSVETGSDGLLHASAAARNLRPILDTLLPALPREGVVLELASGTGQHVAALAAHRPDLTFHPTEPDAARRMTIDARCAGLVNVRAARALDACQPGWGAGVDADAVLLVNLLHLISDAEMAVLLDEVARAVVQGGLFAVYGPFLREGITVSPGDAAFHEALRADDPGIGLKEVEVVEEVLDVLGFAVTRTAMPANNLMLLARKSAVPGL